MGEDSEPADGHAPGDGRHAARQWLLSAVPFAVYVWWRGGYPLLLTALAIAAPLALIARLIPEEMRRNERVWIGYQVGAIIVAAIATVVVVF